MKISLAEELENKRLTILSMQKFELGLEDNCRRWADKLERVYRAADRMAAVCKDRKLRQAYWDEKSRP